jgi:hypothetical protein
MSKIILAVIPGTPISATYEGGLLVSQEGDFEAPAEGPGLIQQRVTFRGQLVDFKDGRRVPVFQTFDTQGRDAVFPTLSDRLDFLAQSGLPMCPPYPGRDVPPVPQLLQWTMALPFHCDSVWVVEDDDPLSEEYLPLPTKAYLAEVADVAWRRAKGGTLVPFLVLADSVEFMGRTTAEIPAKSLVNLKTLGFTKGAKILVCDDWARPLQPGRATWPSRCPECNTPTKFAGFHLQCGRCAKEEMT